MFELTAYRHALSLPVRERGLKFTVERTNDTHHASLPVRERGLKCETGKQEVLELIESLPVRERGLKCPAREG